MLNCQSGLFRKKSGSINFRDFSRDLLSLFCKAMNFLTTKNSWRKKKKKKPFQFPVLSCQQLSNTFVHYQNKKSRLIKKSCKMSSAFEQPLDSLKYWHPGTSNTHVFVHKVFSSCYYYRNNKYEVSIMAFIP